MAHPEQIGAIKVIAAHYGISQLKPRIHLHNPALKAPELLSKLEYALARVSVTSDGVDDLPVETRNQVVAIINTTESLAEIKEKLQEIEHY